MVCIHSLRYGIAFLPPALAQPYQRLPLADTADCLSLCRTIHLALTSAKLEERQMNDADGLLLCTSRMTLSILNFKIIYFTNVLSIAGACWRYHPFICHSSSDSTPTLPQTKVSLYLFCGCLLQMYLSVTLGHRTVVGMFGEGR